MPPPDNYDIKRNIDIKPINPKQPCGFGHSFQSYRRTCDIQSDIKVYDFAADSSNAPQLLPNLNYAKKRNPVYSQGKAKQFTLWDKEEAKSFVTPGPSSYNQDDSVTKMTRFTGISLGFDVKSN